MTFAITSVITASATASSVAIIAATAAATSIIAAAAATTRAVFSFTDPDRAAVKINSIEVFDSTFAYFATGESDEGKSTGTARIPVQRHVKIDDGLVFGKKFAELVLGGLVRQIANIQFHLISFLKVRQ